VAVSLVRDEELALGLHGGPNVLLALNVALAAVDHTVRYGSIQKH
jgi:hypothetical protein